MAKLAEAMDTQISSDESNTSLDTVRDIIEKKAADIINIKISKNGGLFRSKKLLHLLKPPIYQLLLVVQIHMRLAGKYAGSLLYLQSKRKVGWTLKDMPLFSIYN